MYSTRLFRPIASQLPAKILQHSLDNSVQGRIRFGAPVRPFTSAIRAAWKPFTLAEDPEVQPLGMDNAWDERLWKPTTPQKWRTSVAEGFRSIDFGQLTSEIANMSQCLSAAPYNPFLWMGRATNLMGLGYPELAAGDCHKARLLVLARIETLRGKPNALGEQVSLRLHGVGSTASNINMDATEQQMMVLHLNSTLLLICALTALEDFGAVQELCSEGQNFHPAEPHFRDASERAQSDLAMIRECLKDSTKKILSIGRVHHEPYPFVKRSYLTRGPEAVQSAKKALGILSSTCTLAPRQFYMSSDTTAAELGVFATSDIRPGQQLFEDPTILGATSVNTLTSSVSERNPVCDHCCGTIPAGSKRKTSPACCSATYCSQHCQAMASAFYHKAICGRAFDWVFQEANRKGAGEAAMSGPVWLRTLAICAQSDCHPLDHPSLASLIANYKQERSRAWNYLYNLVQPNRILHQLGVDIFQDLRYDTWVLQHLDLRIRTNSHDADTRSDGKPLGRRVRAINPLYSFLNHSCEPNVDWGPVSPRDRGPSFHGSTVVVIARRPISKGEEICIDYYGVSLIRDKQERQRKLRNWLAGDTCECSRCQREP